MWLWGFEEAEGDSDKKNGAKKRHFKGVIECGADMHRQALRDRGALAFSINILFNQDQNSKVILRGENKTKQLFFSPNDGQISSVFESEFHEFIASSHPTICKGFT